MLEVVEDGVDALAGEIAREREGRGLERSPMRRHGATLDDRAASDWGVAERLAERGLEIPPPQVIPPGVRLTYRRLVRSETSPTSPATARRTARAGAARSARSAAR